MFFSLALLGFLNVYKKTTAFGWISSNKQTILKSCNSIYLIHDNHYNEEVSYSVYLHVKYYL